MEDVKKIMPFNIDSKAYSDMFSSAPPAKLLTPVILRVAKDSKRLRETNHSDRSVRSDKEV